MSRPFFHLHAGDELIATALGAEQRGLAFSDVKPILAESIDNVRFVRNENRVVPSIGAVASSL
jgi:hypothetical protein